jgi:hypothetical protein
MGFTTPALHTDSHTSYLGFHNADSRGLFVDPHNVDSADSHVSSSLGFNNVGSRETLSLGLSNRDSRTSLSLGPSDSASQNAASDDDKAAVQHLLQLVEAPSKWPPCVHPSILWYYEDCLTDKTAGDIVTDSNKHRPKMQLVIHREDGSVISPVEFDNIRRSADIHAERLIELTTSSSNIPTLLCSSMQSTKSNIKKWFRAKFNQAILELEAEQKYLCLCSAHWKADTMIGQAFLRLSDAEHKHRAREASSVPNPLSQRDHVPASVPVSSVEPANSAKRALEWSPGPKSPSASHTQKRSKDGTRNKEPSAPLPDSEYSLH